VQRQGEEKALFAGLGMAKKWELYSRALIYVCSRGKAGRFLLLGQAVFDFFHVGCILHEPFR
jgi:hypothetical protein